MTTCISSRYSLWGKTVLCVLGVDCRYTLYWRWTAHASTFRLVTQVEEHQFQEYAGKVIAEAESRGANTQPLRKAAKAGAGQ